MSITAGVCTSYKVDVLRGQHTPSHNYKFALFTSAANLDTNTTSYTGLSAEVASGNGYSTGGKLLTGFTTSSAGGVAWVSFDDVSWTAATITARGGMIYNDSLAGKNAVAIFSFNGDITSTNGTFTINMPVADASSALIRLT